MTAISAFTSSLSHGSLAQIETVLLQLVSEVRQGRRYPSLVSLLETANDSSVWRELESELAMEGISGAEVAKHKVSIKIFIEGLLCTSSVDTASLVEVASLIESGKDETNSESLSQLPLAIDLSPEDPARLLTTDDARDGSLASVDDEEYDSVDEEYESADEEFTTLYAGASNLTIQSGLPELSLNEVPAHCDQVLLSEQSPTLQDALAYLWRVEAVFVHQPVKYQEVLDVMQNFKREVLNTLGVIEWVSTLLLCYQDLLLDFNAFLPHGYRIECGVADNHQAFRAITPFAAYVKIPDLEAIQSLNLGEEDLHVGLLKWIDPASLNILQPCSRTAVDWTTEQSGSEAPGAVQARLDFLRRFKAYLGRLKATKKTATDIG